MRQHVLALVVKAPLRLGCFSAVKLNDMLGDGDLSIGATVIEEYRFDKQPARAAESK